MSDKFAWEVINDYINLEQVADHILDNIQSRDDVEVTSLEQFYNDYSDFINENLELYPELTDEQIENIYRYLDEKVSLLPLETSEEKENKEDENPYTIAKRVLDEVVFNSPYTSIYELIASIPEGENIYDHYAQDIQEAVEILREDFTAKQVYEAIDQMVGYDNNKKRAIVKSYIETPDYGNFFIYTKDNKVVTRHNDFYEIHDGQDMDYVVDNMLIQFFNTEEDAIKKAEELHLEDYTVEVY